ncbi:hypothetical protein Zmor_006129 [Zophobas morio]|uniref:Transposable element P transposase-like C-terminal domain-containing protein n=1 Tax=Zophobas morio TaxID=2755281 RepID=A0AA38IR68_9CUCU|nr:hypothetical protein Zmor_006129 [Zophobas morio]
MEPINKNKINILIKCKVEELQNESTQNSSRSFSSNASSSSELNTTGAPRSGPEVTDDALEYIAGYLAKKFKNTDPTLGDFTYKKKQQNYLLPSGISYHMVVLQENGIPRLKSGTIILTNTIVLH